MKSDKFSHGASKPNLEPVDDSREWEELADALEPLEREAAGSASPFENAVSPESESPVDAREEARLAEERRESRSHEDLVKAGVERAADDQESSVAMRHHV